MPASPTGLDDRLYLGKGAEQLWYAETWIRAEAETPVTLAIQTKPQTSVRALLNDTVVHDDSAKNPSGKGNHTWLADSAPAVLRPGWNHIRLRTYSWGYGNVKAGLSEIAPLERLWGLRCSGQPPAQ